jgi:2-polyprenyl-3-methyl-5-hydroxy-6-metoxy-1,4-benzoquinol methylase
MVRFSTKYRSEDIEIMDDFDLQGSEMKLLLDDLQWVNKWLGGTKISLEGISVLLKDLPKDRTITLIDVGCGDGEMLRQCADYALKEGYTFQLIGLDANAHILVEAKSRSMLYSNISFQKIDVFSKENSIPECDIALCTLMLHHFKHKAITALLQKLSDKAKVGIVVNDLERSTIAFWLFKGIGFLFLNTDIARHDGLVSIARGFIKEELIKISEGITATTLSIKWKWAFRHQWILKTKE